jgi:hypothetical protein
MWRCGRESKSVGKELQTNVENRVKLVILTFALAIIPLVNWCCQRAVKIGQLRANENQPL